MDKFIVLSFSCMGMIFFFYTTCLYLFKPDESWEFHKNNFLKNRYHKDDIFEKPDNWGRSAFLGELFFLLVATFMFVTIATSG